MSVIACAGSGKTFTAVRRLAHIRRCLGDHRGRVALLSFSNIAVETFRREYQALAVGSLKIPSHQRVEIDTLDGFITTNILRPHAHRTMGCTTTPFLLSGSESFLLGKDYRFWVESPRTGNYPVPQAHIHRVVIGPSGAGTDFFYQNSGMLTRINNGPKAAAALGKLGLTPTSWRATGPTSPSANNPRSCAYSRVAIPTSSLMKRRISGSCTS